jgi:hypothetical protein
MQYETFARLLNINGHNVRFISHIMLNAEFYGRSLLREKGV